MKKITISLVSFAILAGCSFLDKTPLDKLSEESVYNSDALAESYVNSMYSVLSDPFQEGNISSISDESFFRYGGTSTRYIMDGNMTESNVMYIDEGGQAHNSRTTTLNIWNRAYEYIYRMNSFLINVKNAEKISAEQKARLTGEVLYLRAWAYYNLIQRYGGVPYITKVFDLSGPFGVKRDKFDTCVDNILKDLEEAEKLLPSKENSAYGRANKDVVLALRCRLTLLAASPLFNDKDNPEGSIFRGQYDDKKWERAYAAAKAIVDRADKDGAYAMEPTYDGFWLNPYSTENIWCKYFVNTQSGNKAQLLYSVVYFNGWTSMEPTQAILIDYEMKNGKKFFEEGSGYDPEHPFKNRDPRFYKTIAAPFEIYKHTDTDGSYTEEPLQLYHMYINKTRADFDKSKPEPTADDKHKHLWSLTQSTGLELNKWYNPKRSITESETVTTHYPWFRLPEMYLNLAECAFMLNKPDECRKYINKIRDRGDVMMPHVTESGSDLWDRYMNERRIEFAFEFMRYFDLRRWKVADFWENVPICGMRTMILTDANKTPKDTLYRMVKVYDPSTNDKNYYWEYSSSRPQYVYAGLGDRKGETIDYIITYKWLGKEYRIDYGDCTMNISPTPKYFPKKGDVYPNYLMPIPHNEMIKSAGTIEQNPGY